MKLMLVLSALCALLQLLSNGWILTGKERAIAFLSQRFDASSLYFWKENFLFFLSANITMYVFCFLAALAILYGCYLMWKGFKWGLLFYTCGKIVQLSIPVLYLGHRMIAIGDIMFALLFLVFYYAYCFSHQMDKSERKYNQITDNTNN